MWIVRVALKRPYTFVVLAILILILGTLSIFRTPTDIFPNINIPVVSIIWNYTGLSPTEMSNRIITLQERNLSTTVNDIEHIESQSLNGIAVIKVFFHPGVNISMAIAQIAGQSQTQLKQLPGGTTISIRAVANVRDGFPPQTNIVRVDRRRSTLMTIQKIGNASTLDIITAIKNLLPKVKTTLPQDLQIRLLADQSVFVRGAISGVLREALIAACLTAAMILLFLGSWRSTVIIAISIPLSILTSIILLSFLGETINLMTLGGLALAVGILVDDATVTIENIHRYLGEGKGIEEAIIDGAQQIAIPAPVSTLSICIVFVPMFLLTGVARYLFVPLAEAVVFAMLASYLLSRTLVPTLAKYFLKAHAEGNAHEASASRNPLVRFQSWFEHGFETIRSAYRGLLETLIAHRRIFAGGFLLASFLSFALLPWLGQDFFPSVDSGAFTLHMRAPTGMRIEETAALCDRVENEIRAQIPPGELVGVIDNIGLPYSGINLSYINSAPVGTQDADIIVSLSGKHHPTAGYVHDLRLKLPRDFPGATFYFLPSDMVTQILNFGLPAPIDIQVVGNDLEGNRQFADKLLSRVRSVSGTSDLRIQQTFDQRKLHIDVDRTKADAIGFTQREVATNLLVTLSGSSQTSPSF